MEKFSEVYDFSRKLLKAKCFEKWSKAYQTELEALFAEGGPSEANAKVLETIRELLSASPPPLVKLRGQPKSNSADEIANLVVRYTKLAQQDPAKGLDTTAAFLKMLKHFYFVSQAGNQVVWVADSPAAYKKFTYDLFSGKSERSIVDACRQNHEVFGENGRKLFSEGLTLARKWSMDVFTKLGAPDDNVKKLIKRWFGVGDDIVDGIAIWLKLGFKDIANACNETRVVFSDDPLERSNSEPDPLAATRFAEKEAMLVIYISKPYLALGKKDRKGNLPKLWFAALTIIHELSHKIVHAEDHRYDWDGIKPAAHRTHRKFDEKEAIWNADSWAYFAADMVGAIPRKDFRETYR